MSTLENIYLQLEYIYLQEKCKSFSHFLNTHTIIFNELYNKLNTLNDGDSDGEYTSTRSTRSTRSIRSTRSMRYKKLLILIDNVSGLKVESPHNRNDELIIIEKFFSQLINLWDEMHKLNEETQHHNSAVNNDIDLCWDFVISLPNPLCPPCQIIHYSSQQSSIPIVIADDGINCFDILQRLYKWILKKIMR
jgi:hypothetical protein